MAAALAGAQRAVAPDATIAAAEQWAFPVRSTPDPGAPPGHAQKPDPGEMVHVPGSTRSYTQAQLDRATPDWFPQDHPVAPRIVTEGRKPASRCAECHFATGTGVPATAALNGLPRAYILGQVAAFRSGERRADALETVRSMTQEARSLDAADLQRAADYFSKVEFVPRVHVVEAATVPKTHWKYFVLVPDKGGAHEPIGERIIEMPTDYRSYEYSSNRTAYVAYVPPGNVERGAVVAAKGIGAAQPCESCHGANLQGVADVPALAGRSPTYIVRELILFREGKRTGSSAAPMRLEAAQLTVDDMIDVAAYAASHGS